MENLKPEKVLFIYSIDMAKSKIRAASSCMIEYDSVAFNGLVVLYWDWTIELYPCLIQNNWVQLKRVWALQF